jgi:hypothetical protein
LQIFSLFAAPAELAASKATTNSLSKIAKLHQFIFSAKQIRTNLRPCAFKNNPLKIKRLQGNKTTPARRPHKRCTKKRRASCTEAPENKRYIP